MADGIFTELRQLISGIQGQPGVAISSPTAAVPRNRWKRRETDYSAPRLFKERLVSNNERKLGAALAAVLVLLAIAVTPYAGMPLPPVPAFLVAYSTAQIILSVLVAVLLICKSRIENDHGQLGLGAAYLFCALVVTVHLLTFPGALVPGMILGTTGSSTWMWTFWHGGFPLLVTGCCLRVVRGATATARPRARDAVLLAVTLAGIAGFLGVYHVNDLPQIMQAGPFFTGRIGLTVEALVLSTNVFAAVLVLVAFRLRTALGLWLAVGMVGTCVDVWMSARSGHRYTLGWYCGRIGGISSVLVVLSSLLNDILVTYSSVSAANDVLDKLTLTDALTNLGNRRLFDKTLATEWRRCRRDGVPLTVIMIDVDSFKAFNDTYGHQAGDSCLQQISAQLGASATRPGDMTVRYGGEEFALILPATDSDGGSHLAQLIRLRIRDLAIVHDGCERGIITVSVGVASLVPSEAFDMSELVKLADVALYRAKAGGRDTVIVAG